MVLGFKERFVGKILSGIKIHTIREDRNGRWFEGRLIHFAVGVRTKNYTQFAYGFCTDVKLIIMEPSIKKIQVNGVELSESEKEFLRTNDGFDSMLDFWEWFNKPFVGVLIYFRVEKKYF